MKNKIPKEQVIKDMHDPMHMYAREARQYYYDNYATDSEKDTIDREIFIEKLVSICFVLLTVILFILFLIKE